jgi:DNA-binding response OmpR family regulator
MIVDDDRQVTDLLQKLLQVEGFETVGINDSSRAVETARTENPDLFLLDLMMPQPDGFKLCRLLRQDPSFLFTPIIIVTALDDSDSRVVAFGAGANDYITKPFMPDDLIQRVREMLE